MYNKTIHNEGWGKKYTIKQGMLIFNNNFMSSIGHSSEDIEL